ncbi:MAG: hypothetical protein EOM31_02540 [Bacteroidia bacterium]|nr:hypothetical protein [Bacteroidia bacterium]
MKNFLVVMVVMALILTGCTKDNWQEEVDALKGRVTALEGEVKNLNGNIEAIRLLAQKGMTVTSAQVSEGIWTVTLSDGKVLKLVEKSEKPTLLPLIGIDANGNWTVSYDNGQTYQVVLNASQVPVKAKGENGVTPQFRVSAAGYWEVSYNGGTSFEAVKDVDGQPVKAVGTDGTNGTDGAASGDKFFKEVAVQNGNLHLVLLDGTTLTVPVVSNFYCRFGNEVSGVQNFNPAETKQFNLEIKGADQVLITAPNGWKAVLAEADANQIAVLTVTAPKADTRATADNSKDLAILATSGSYACIAKIQVEVGSVTPQPTRTDYYESYEKGDNLVVGGVTINKAMMADYTVETLTAENGTLDITDKIHNLSTPTLLFLEGDQALYTISGGVKAITQPVIIIGRYADEKPTLQSEFCMKLVAGKLILKNISVDMTKIDGGSNKGYLFNNANATANFENLVFEDCLFTHVIKPIYNAAKYDSGITSISIKNTQIGCQLAAESTVNIALINLYNTTTLDAYPEVVFQNNVVYNKTAMKGQLFVWADANSPTPANEKEVGVTISNNTFVNFVGANIFCKFYQKAAVTLKNNLFYADATGATLNSSALYAFLGTTPAATVDVANNVVYDLKEARKWSTYHSKSSVTVADGENLISNYAQSPFAKFDLGTGVFTPIAELAGCGARID